MSEWIKCSARLPEFNKIVLVYVDGCGVYVDEYIDRGYAEYFATWNELVTHWQPLPEPPTN